MEYEIVPLRKRPDLKEPAARWFHEKWGIPLQTYRESMEACLAGGSTVPQWYVALEGDRIIGGLGVIENDFHDRKDLTRMSAPSIQRPTGAAAALPERCWNMCAPI